MNIRNFLHTLEAQGFELWVDGDRLRYRGPNDVIDNMILDKISAYKTEILSLLRNGADPQKTYPLSYGQKALWFLNQLSPNNAAYNIGISRHIRLKADESFWRRIFQRLIARHAILRTTYTTVEGEPVQKIHGYKEFFIKQTDASSWKRDELNRRIVEEYNIPFNLEKGPLLRVNLFSRSDLDHIILLTMPHIAVDGWSLSVLLDELSAIVMGELTGKKVFLPPLHRRYTDFVDWQAGILTGSEGERHWAYWRKQLSGDLKNLNLKTDSPRPSVQTYNGASHHFSLDRNLTERLRNLARSEGATLYMTLLAAFQLLLHFYTGQDDILVGSITSGRSKTEFAGVVGYFVNPIVLRADLSGNPTFRIFLNQSRHRILDAIMHQDYPFSLIVDRLRIEHDPSRPVLFQAMFNYNKNQHPTQVKHFLIDGKQFNHKNHNIRYPILIEDEYFSTREGEGQFDITLEMNENNGLLQGAFKYNRDLFDAPTIVRMEVHLRTLLEEIAAKPAYRISELTILPEEERRQLLLEWNDTNAEYPYDKCIHELIKEQAKKTPDATAVIFENTHLTYGELDNKASRLAVYLNGKGVETGTFVGIFMERSLEMMIGLIGILKAGGAYVPLDPGFPPNRLSYVLEDTKLPILITQSFIEDRLPECKAHIIKMDSDWDEIPKAQRIRKPDNKVGPEDLAYVIYTSGSTGQPKGVEILHRGLTNMLWSMAGCPGFTDQDCLLALTTLCFDIAALELFLPLIKGGRVEILPAHILLDPFKLKEKIESNTATVIQGTPALWQMLMNAGWKGKKLVKILCGGESLSQKLADQLLVHGKEVWNMYGPTETTIWSSMSEIKPRGKINIGRPIANTQFYILDSQLRPVPLGVPGELHIGGNGLAKGYYNHPEFTSKAFIPHPFDNSTRSRLYKTGDLVRYLPDGNVEYLGRLDSQIKFHGFRIELGEIEAVLGEHPAVNENVVIIMEDRPEPRRLVAYIVPSRGQWPVEKEFRQYLKKRLPDYMIPSTFVMLEAFPLTPNGKVDRNRLPAPGRMDLEKGYISPQTEVEKKVTSICSEVLRIEKIGMMDNFFHIGGNSLLATKLAARLLDVFSLEIPVRAVFEARTVQEICQKVEDAHSKGGLHLPPIQPAFNKDNVPLSFAQERLWFLHRLFPDNPFYNMPAPLRLKGPLNITALERTLKEIVRRHKILRTRFESSYDRPIQVTEKKIPVPLEKLDLQHLGGKNKEEKVQRIVTKKALLPFDLAKDFMFRASLFKINDMDHIFLLNMHHIISDEWSVDLLLRELFLLYEAFSNGRPSPLNRLSVQYSDYSVWQRNRLSGAYVDELLAYWQKKLRGMPRVHNLPLDKPRPCVQSFRGDHHRSMIDKKTTDGLKKLCRSIDATLFMVLRAVLSVFIYRYSGECDVVIGTTIANRLQVEVESIIGLFANTLALRADLTDNPRFMDLMKIVKEDTISAYDHQYIPFDLLVRALNPDRTLSHNPLFQLMFVLNNNPKNQTTSHRLHITHFDIDYPVSKFDLTIRISEIDDRLFSDWEYATDLFNKASIRRMNDHFSVLLKSIIMKPDIRIDDLPLLMDQEHCELLTDWSHRNGPYRQPEYIVL